MIPVELDLNFKNKESWDSFVSSNEWLFDRKLIEQSADLFRLCGIVDPVFGYSDGEFIEINSEDFRESVVTFGLNSRLRALLHASLELRLSNHAFLTTLVLSDRVEVVDSVKRLFLVVDHCQSCDEFANYETKDETYDLIIMTDFYTNIHTVYDVLRISIARLNCGGRVLATFPYHYRSYFDDGESSQADEGSQKRVFPGWEVIDLMRSAGCADCGIRALASTRAGIIGSDQLAVFVFYALKC